MSIRRICKGYNFREIQEPLIVIGDLGDNDLVRCEELGMVQRDGLSIRRDPNFDLDMTVTLTA